MAFLNRIREADPQQRTIDRAMLNEQNELGLILDRSVEMQNIPDLMRAILGQMANEFPKSGFNRARLYALGPAAEDRHRPSRCQDTRDELRPGTMSFL